MKITAPRLLLLSALIVGCACSISQAWSTKEHIQITRLSAMRLIADPATPPAMRDWLKAVTPDLTDMAGEKEFLLKTHVGATPKGYEGLSMWSYMPDVLAASEPASKAVVPFGAHEKLMHYIDLELFCPGEGTQTYADDLSHKPKFADIPRDLKDPRYQKAGFLPFRVEDCYQKTVAAIRAGRLKSAGEDSAGKWAGFLAHYAADNTMPMHATIDYKAASYFASWKKPPNIHADMEYRLVDDEKDDYPKLREEFWALLTRELAEGKEPAVAADPWKGTVQTCLISYDALPMIGHAALAAYGEKETTPAKFDADAFFHYKGRYLDREMTVMEMKAYQEAWAVKRLAGLWRQAWDEAARPAPATQP